MASINFYLDKSDKKGLSPIHLRINCNNEQVKLSVGIKVQPHLFDKKTQQLIGDSKDVTATNHFLDYLKERADELLNDSSKKTYTIDEVKDRLHGFIEGYKEDTKVNLVKDQLALYGKEFTFIDLFAGAGGFSEGFLQAEHNNKWFDFLCASDINENCELTHIVRYNHQLNLEAQFLKQDITEPDYLENLIKKLNGKKVDVVCGGPPCQSFSLAGKRKKHDKKDDLFAHYLEVIKRLQPRYFVMENVKGLLTKGKGKIKARILTEIRSIVDINEIDKLRDFVLALKRTNAGEEFLIDCLNLRVTFEKLSESNLDEAREDFVRRLENKFRILTPKIVDYKTSKTDERVSTIRHGFNLLLRKKQLEKLKRDIIREKDHCNVDNDYFVDSFTEFLDNLDASSIIDKIEMAFESLKVHQKHQKAYSDILTALKIYIQPFENCVEFIKKYCTDSQEEELEKLLDSIRLYRIKAPFVANASNYGVPQNRERVLFIGCRKDQKLISEIPPTVTEDEKVTVFEALHDLDFIDNDQEAHSYEKVDLSSQFNGTAKTMKKLIRKRAINGQNGKMGEKTFAEWSRKGRLSKRFRISKPFYVKNFDALNAGVKNYDVLHNHKTSKQNESVVKRLQIILESGDYKEAKVKLNACGLNSQKRNYNVLRPDGQSPTVMTIPDDYIHYNAPRALTVREMARLQSFDDSFVFQGKRSTGGNKRKSEVPQFTLVGNAVPPLMARAVAMEILKHIK